MATLDQQWLEDLQRACLEGEAEGSGTAGDDRPAADVGESEVLDSPPEQAVERGLETVAEDSRPALEEEGFREEAPEEDVLPARRKRPLRANVSPEENELRRKRAKFSEFESQLADKELYFTNLQTELFSIKNRYLKEVGVRYAELDELQAQYAELHARSRPLDAEARKAARLARRQANRSRAAVERPVAPASPTPSPTLKRLYREVAKRIHPDLGVGAVDRTVRARLMAEANRAYQHGNESRLRAIVLDYECSPETVSGEGTAAELVRIIRKTARARRRLADLEHGAQRLLRSDLYQLKRRVDKKAEQGSDLLEEMSARVGERIARARRKLAELVDEVGPL
jgi:hypothetical protein